MPKLFARKKSESVSWNISTCRATTLELAPYGTTQSQCKCPSEQVDAKQNYRLSDTETENVTSYCTITLANSKSELWNKVLEVDRKRQAMERGVASRGSGIPSGSQTHSHPVQEETMKQVCKPSGVLAFQLPTNKVQRAWTWKANASVAGCVTEIRNSQWNFGQLDTFNRTRTFSLLSFVKCANYNWSRLGLNFNSSFDQWSPPDKIEGPKSPSPQMCHS